MKVLCKKDYFGISGFQYYEKDNWYNANIKEANYDMVGKFIEIESIRGTSGIDGTSASNTTIKNFYFKKQGKLNFYDEYFYTQKEMRKLKLEKINELQ